MPTCPYRYVLSVTTLALAMGVVDGYAQQNSSAERLKTAGTMYYTPTQDGLQSFRCDVAFDFKSEFLRQTGLKDIPDDNPLLVYFRSVQLSITDDLHTGGTLNWSETSPPPAGLEHAVEQMRGGFKGIVGVFFQAWNPYMNGTLAFLPAKDSVVEETSTGLTRSATIGRETIDEKFDRNLLLTEVHTLSPSNESKVSPIYVDTKSGKLISEIRATAPSHGTDPAKEVNFIIKYSPVASFQIPSSIMIDGVGRGIFSFNFSSCTVKTTSDKSK